MIPTPATNTRARHRFKDVASPGRFANENAHAHNAAFSGGGKAVEPLSRERKQTQLFVKREETTTARAHREPARLGMGIVSGRTHGCRLVGSVSAERTKVLADG